MDCRLAGAKLLSEPNQCWDIINWTLRKRLKWNFNRHLCIFIQENACENVVWKMSQPQCVFQAYDFTHIVRNPSTLRVFCPFSDLSCLGNCRGELRHWFRWVQNNCRHVMIFAEVNNDGVKSAPSRTPCWAFCHARATSKCHISYRGSICEI